MVMPVVVGMAVQSLRILGVELVVRDDLLPRWEHAVTIGDTARKVSMLFKTYTVAF